MPRSPFFHSVGPESDGEACVEVGCELRAVYISAYEHYLIHSVAVEGVPVAVKIRVIGPQHLQILLGRGGIPISGLSEFFLPSGLLEQERHVAVVAEIHHPLGSYYIRGPVQIDKPVELVEIKRTAAEVNISAYTVLFSLPFPVVMMVVMVAILIAYMMMVMVVVMMILIIMMVILMVMVLVMVVMMVMMVMAVMILLIGIHRTVYLAYPCSGSGHLVEIEEMSSEKISQRNVAVIAFQDTGFRLERTHDLGHTPGLGRGNLGYLIEEHHIAELNLLYKKILDILIIDISAFQVTSASEFIAHTQGIDHCNYIIEAWHIGSVRVVESHLPHGADSLSDGSRFADTARLYNEVIELAGSEDTGNLTHKVGLQRAAYATVLEGHEIARIILPDHTTLLNKRCIYVDFPYIVDYNGEFYTLAIGKDMIQQRSFSAAEISGKQKYRCFFNCHKQKCKKG